MYITKTYTAHQLFEMAWETPILLLAKEIGISDVGLSKACRKVGVALPTRGHWAKPKAKRPRKPKPPVKHETIRFRVLDPTFIAHAPTPIPLPAADRISVQVPRELIEPHPLVRKWLTGVRKAKVSDGYLALEDVGLLTAKISRAQVDRCAILYDTLLKEGEALGLDGPLEVCSDAPEWDWDFFCQLAYVDHSWPRHIVNKPTNLIQLFKHLEADDIGDVTLPELPHHALLDARLLSTLYRELCSPEPQIKER